MIKLLAKYIRPFVLGFIVTIALLFGQALCDLNLPNYMSNIVNVGIQQNGVERAAPEVVSQSGMRLARTFMTEDETSLVDSAYTLVSPGNQFVWSVKGKAFDNVYANAADEDFYALTFQDMEARGGLDEAFGMAAATAVRILTETMSGAGSQPENAGGGSSLDISLLYQAQPRLDAIPAEMLAAAREEAAGNELMVKQAGVMFTRLFYEELGVDTGALQSEYIMKTGVSMLLIALAGGAATVLVGLFATRIATGVARNLRKDIFDKVESFSNAEFDKFSTASLITRCTNDVTQIQMLLAFGIRLMCYAPIMGVGGVIMAVGKSPSMSWIIALAVIALMGLVMVVMAVAMPKFKALQKLVDRLNLVSREALSGLMVIRAFGAQEHEKGRFREANADLTKTNLFINRVMVTMMPVMMFAMNGVMLLIVWVGAHGIADSQMQIGSMMAFMQYAMQIIMSFLMVSMMFIFVPRAAVSALRIREILDTGVSIKDPESPKAFDPEKRGLVEFENVCFRYHDAETDAVSDISFTARPGETTAIIGSTGSGKSTLANLLLRFYDVTGGRILVGGVDVRELRQEDLRAKIGFVPQRGVLLSGTIASNLRYGRKDAEDAELEEAAETAQAMEFIEKNEEGLDYEISQGGGNVSGGQKQRLSIARALAKNPDILIFDDSFSALDFKTDAKLRKALKEKTANAAQIVIAQRVGTIMNADQILVLDEGRIVGAGKHRDLLKTCKEYLEIASTQLSKEELA